MAKPAAKRQPPRRLRWRLLVQRLCRHAKRAGAQAAGGTSRATRVLRHLLSGCARNARDVSVLRAIYLLRSRAREAHRRGQCLGPGRVHRLCRLGEGPHEADVIFFSLSLVFGRYPRGASDTTVAFTALSRVFEEDADTQRCIFHTLEEWPKNEGWTSAHVTFARRKASEPRI